ncbi:Nudix family hydrolase [Marinobacter sp. CHS3-4]|uniref:Nudix family hydrolase n=1 Tax=Marinobacter sp. CHS3-4 TaxID=3045174 RepID=UPI0024B527F0|nr:Nudix family hydrolase [Marinobacter sp. CHS3-4]MDI9246252.1 Nudix family hydrolase [Marinobacter sp. CHS3-4]
MAPVAEVHVAVGVIRRGDKVLIARRPDHLHQGGLLEFPGGKLEPGETVQQALVRETLEETGLTVSAADLTPLIGIRHDYGDKRVFLDVWEAFSHSGEPEGKEGQSVEWRSPSLLLDEEFPAANRPIIRAARLPRRYAITGSARDADDYVARIKRGVPGKSSALCLLRAPELDAASYQEVAARVLSGEAGHQNVNWMLHGKPALLESFPDAAGVHMPWREAQRHRQRPIGSNHWLAVSCHSADEIEHAMKLDADFITLGPVRPTESHPGAPALGTEVFRDLIAQSAIVIYGLGGLNIGDERDIVSLGAQGIAGIGFWWPSVAAQQ